MDASKKVDMMHKVLEDLQIKDMGDDTHMDLAFFLAGATNPDNVMVVKRVWIEQGKTTPWFNRPVKYFIEEGDEMWEAFDQGRKLASR